MQTLTAVTIFTCEFHSPASSSSLGVHTFHDCLFSSLYEYQSLFRKKQSVILFLTFFQLQNCFAVKGTFFVHFLFNLLEMS